MYFKTIKAVLDGTLATTCAKKGITLAEGHALLKEHLLEMNEEWFSGENPQIDYADPFCRLAYLFCHTAANANICEIAIRTQPEIDALIMARANAGEEVRVCAFGGGPGTELLALSKHLTKTHTLPPVIEINFTVLDLVPEWAESWDAIWAQVRTTLRASYAAGARPFQINKSFAPFDMTKVDKYANLAAYLKHDLYIMNYVVSEVIDDVDDLAAVVKEMRKAAPQDALFLIIDRHQPEVEKRADKLVADAKLEVINKGSSCSYMDGDEQKDELEPYVTEVGRVPRVQWRTSNGRGIFWILAKKPARKP